MAYFEYKHNQWLWMDLDLTTKEKAEALQVMLIARATGSFPEEDEYRRLRSDLILENSIKALLPGFVRACRDLGQFWGYIKKFTTYADRRQHVWESFAPLLNQLEEGLLHPSDSVITDALSRLDLDQVQKNWQRSLDRRIGDPEAAITAARTLLESTCKHILTDLNEDFQDDWDLPKLYKSVAKLLNLAPDQHTEQIFKQVLGGCQTVVEGLGAMRNKLGDAHGKAPKPVKPSPRHAQLSVNLAGAMATFLVETWQVRKSSIT